MAEDKIRNFVASAKVKLKHFKKTNCSHNLSRKNSFENQNNSEIYGVVPSLDNYLQVNKSFLLEHFWKLVDEGDLVIGRIGFIDDYGLSINLVCFDGINCMKLDKLGIKAFCPKSELPKRTTFDNVLKRFSAGDLIRGEIIEVSTRQSNLVVSLIKDDLNWNSFKYGIISEDDLPIYYKRSLTSTDNFDKTLNLSVGFYNPHVVEYLRKYLIQNSKLSFFEDLHNLSFPSEQYAPQLRKTQSSKVAEVCVKRGVDLCQKGEKFAALAEMNKALKLDPTNVNAIVAKGAVYANHSAYQKAIESFTEALDLKPSHENAKKYLVEVLIEKGKSLCSKNDDKDQIYEAKALFRRVLNIEPQNKIAKEEIKNLEALRYQQSEENQERLKKETFSDESQTVSISKVKLLLENDVSKHKRRKNRKKKRETSSESSESSSSSSDQTPPSKKKKKNKKKQKTMMKEKILKHKMSSVDKKIRRISDSRSSRGPTKDSNNDFHRYNNKNEFQKNSKTKSGLNASGSKSHQIITSSSIRKIDNTNLNDILACINQFESKKKV